MLQLDNVIDMHMHSHPAPFERIADSAEIGLWCAEAKMGGLVIKSHFESTVSKVYHARKIVEEIYPDFKLYAGIALNRGVGGVNPGAVEIALEQDAKIVWLPTFDSLNHSKAFGASGTYGFEGMTFSSKRNSSTQQKYTIFDENNKLSLEAKEIIRMISDYDCILATGHVSVEEIIEATNYAFSVGVKRIVVTHPEFKVPNLDVETMVDLSRQGVFMEFCAVNCFPVLYTASLDKIAELIRKVSPNQVVLASDSGQVWSARPPETLRVFMQGLHEKGVSQRDIETMTISNPRKLLGLPPLSEVIMSEP